MNRKQGSNPEQSARAFSWPAFVLVFCALMLPASLWLLESDRRQSDTRLEMQAEQARIELQRRLRQQESVLRAMVAFVEVNPGLDASDFNALVERLIAPYPHIRSVHFHQLVAHEDRAAFEAEMRARGQTGYSIVDPGGENNQLNPAASRPWYLPVSFVAPLESAEDRRFLGLDLLEEPVVQETVQRALESGMAAGPVAIPMRGADAGYFLVRDLTFDGVLGNGARALMSIAAHSGQLLPLAVRPPGMRVWLEGPGLAQAARPEVDQRSRFPLGLRVVEREVEIGNQKLLMIMQRQRGWRDLNGTGLLLLLAVSLLAGWAGGSSRGQRQYYRRQLVRQSRQQRIEQTRTRAAAAAVRDAIILTDAGRRIVAFNPAAEALTGRRREDVIGRGLDEVLRLRTGGGVAVELTSALPGAPGHATETLDEFMLGRSDGTRVPVRLRRLVPEGSDAEAEILVLHEAGPDAFPDTAPAAESDRDGLTGLADRQRLKRHIETIQADPTRGIGSVLLVVALPDLSALREHYDSESADELLQLAGRILDARRRSDDLLARLDDHHFGLMLHECSLADARKVAGEILASLRECHFSSADRYLQVVPCVGLVELSAHTAAAQILRRGMQAAAAAARQPERISSDVADAGNVQGGGQGDTRAQRLLEALEEQRFELHAQPVMDLTTTPVTMNHQEVLLRMHDEQGRQLLPAQFMPLAEREQLMARLDRWVLEQVVAWLADQPGQARPLLALNLSAQTLADTALIPRVRELLERYGVAGRCLRFEFKEPVAAARAGSLGRVMDELRRDDVSFCLDNFGTGPNGFLPPRYLQFEALKIDAALVQAAGRDINEAAIIEAICHVARVRGMQVVAEGVADADTLGVVRQLGIHLAQGNHLGEPEPLNPR